MNTGTFKKFKPALALESMQTAMSHIASGSSQVQISGIALPFKSVDGTPYARAYINSSNAYPSHMARTFSPYGALIPVPTNDALDDYSIDDYSYTALGTNSFTYTGDVVDDNGVSEIFNVAITNTTGSDITVKCIKFYKEIVCAIATGTTMAMKNCLICAYYLDTPVTIPNGSSTNISVALRVSLN